MNGGIESQQEGLTNKILFPGTMDWVIITRGQHFDPFDAYGKVLKSLTLNNVCMAISVN